MSEQFRSVPAQELGVAANNVSLVLLDSLTLPAIQLPEALPRRFKRLGAWATKQNPHFKANRDNQVAEFAAWLEGARAVDFGY